MRLAICLRSSARVFGFAHAVVAAVGGDYVWSLKLLALGHAERCIFIFEQGKRLVGEPRRVAELEGEVASRQGVEEIAQQRGIGFQEWRELKEDKAKFAGLAQRLQRSQEATGVFTGIAQFLDVSDALVRLHGKTEAIGCICAPTVLRLLRREVAKGVVHLDGVQARGVILQEFCCRQFLRIEVRLPSRIRPS